jgi:hypothetical protein
MQDKFREAAKKTVRAKRMITHADPAPVWLSQCPSCGKSHHLNNGVMENLRWTGRCPVMGDTITGKMELT